MLFRIACGFAGNGVARAASAVAVGAAALGDKAGDDPVEAQAVVKAFADELGEVGDRTRSLFFKLFNSNGAAIHFDNCFFHGDIPLFFRNCIHYIMYVRSGHLLSVSMVKKKVAP